MHPADIKSELEKNHITQASIANELKVSPMAVSLVRRKKMVSDRIMKFMSKAIGRDHREVFPEYYFSQKRRKKAA